MKTSLKILHVEDEPLDSELIQIMLEKEGWQIELQRVETKAEYLAIITAEKFDAILSDYSLPVFDGFAALQLRQELCPEIPFILISGTLGEEAAIEAFRRGATDYILKHRLERLIPSLSRALRETDERKTRQRLETQLQQAQKMEAIGRLAGGIAHDFNNLLTAILGYSSLLSKTIPPESPQHRELEEIIRAGQMAADLTQQLLTFSRGQTLAPQIVDLNSIIHATQDLLKNWLGARVTLQLDLSASIPLVKTDPRQMERVIMNLAINARDAMPDGGTLHITTAYSALTDVADLHGNALEPGHYVLLQVSDNGSGMTEETKSHLFEPFFTTKEIGTGLGLATVYGIIQQSGGAIFVASEPGKGTTFRVYLPAYEVTEAVV